MKNSLCLSLGLGTHGGPPLVPVGMIPWLAVVVQDAPLGAILPVPIQTSFVFASYQGPVDKWPLLST